jgi:photosystem II stability/assembly factor-like uncharacterized protein
MRIAAMRIAVSKILRPLCVSACLSLAAGSLLAHDPHDPMLIVAVSPNYANDHTLLVATGNLSLEYGATFLFRSTDGGVNWAPVSGLLSNLEIYAVAFSPAYASDQTIFVASAVGLFCSTNAGNSWTSLSALSLVSLALSPNFANDNTLFVATGKNQLFRSQNRGVTLTGVSVPAGLTSAITAIAVSPNLATDHTFFLGSKANGIFKTSNGGKSWTLVTTNITSNITALAFSPAYSSDQTIFAGTLGSGVLVSTNAGSSFIEAISGLSDTKVSSLAFSPAYASDSTLWATTAGDGVFQSTSHGLHWSRPITVPRQLSPLTNLHYQMIAAGPGIQILAMFEGLWVSTNRGASWQYIDTIPTRMARFIHPSPNYAQDRTLFVTTYGSGNLWSTDGGASWALENTGMVAPYIDGSDISPNFAADGTAFSGNYIGLQRTNDKGATWQLMAGPGQSAYPRGLAVSPNFANDQTVYIGTTSDTAGGQSKAAPGLYISTDAGQTWILSSLRGQGVISIAFSPGFATDQTAFAASETGGLYITTNSGAAWTQLNVTGASKEMVQVIVSPNFPVDRVVFAVPTEGGIYKSSDGGTSWVKTPNTTNMRALDVRLSPNYPADQTIFAGTIPFGLIESTNGGASFSPVASFPDVAVTAVGISPNFANDQTLFAAGYHGLFESTNGGATWAYLVTPARIEESRNIASTLQEPPTIVYQGDWSFVTPSALASTNEFASTTTDNTAILSFSGSGVRWISETGPDQGTAAIEVDGIALGNVSLTGTTELMQQVVWEQHGLACGNHTFTITASPLVTQSVTLDAFDIWVDNCPFPNPIDAVLGATSTTVKAIAGNAGVPLTTAGAWTAASDAPWLSISPGSASGTGDALIQFTYAANIGLTSRVGTLTIDGVTFMVRQKAAAPSALP